MSKVNLQKKSGTSHWEISVSFTTQECDNVTTPYYSILLYCLSSDRLREVKNEKKNQTFSSKSGRSRLREVVAYKRFQMQWFDLETFGILENWSLRRGDRLREMVATGSSTVLKF